MKSLAFLFLLGQILVVLSDNVPAFTLNAERSLDGSPSLTITFPDGYTDTLILNKYYSNAEDELVRMAEKEHCNFLGKLAKEGVCVAMTGCPGQDDLEFTILSSHAKNGGLYRWSKDGNVQVIESQYKSIYVGMELFGIVKEEPLLEQSFLLPVTKNLMFWLTEWDMITSL